MKKIGVFTSGGDAPGMNACIRAVVRTAQYNNVDIYGIQRGYHGMIEGMIIEMDASSVSNIIQRGGTMLKTARCKEFETAEGRFKAYEQIKAYGLDGLVAIGGNGTYTGASIFFKEFGVPIIGVPGTIDNDLYGTDHTIGFDTAINTAMEAIDKIRDTADSHDRMFFIEVMGRDAGFIAMDVGISGGAEAVLVPETHTDLNHLIDILRKGWGRKKGSQLIVVAEGDDAGGVVKVVAKVKEKVPNLDCRIVVLGHIQRGGSPTARDRVIASRLGAGAVEALLKGHKNEAIGIVNDKIHFTAMEEAYTKKKSLDRHMIDLAEMISA